MERVHCCILLAPSLSVCSLSDSQRRVVSGKYIIGTVYLPLRFL